MIQSAQAPLIQECLQATVACSFSFTLINTSVHHVQLSLANLPKQAMEQNSIDFLYSTQTHSMSGMPVFAYTKAAAGALQLRTEGNCRSASVRGKVQCWHGMCTVCF